MKEPILRFHEGTLILKNWNQKKDPPYFQWDHWTRNWRTPAIHYSKIIHIFQEKGIPLKDTAKAFTPLEVNIRFSVDLYSHQIEALKSWEKFQYRGTVVLPTGTGKSLVGIHAIMIQKISTLIICPTIDLMNQWYSQVTDTFDTEIGILGGGYHEIHPVTVTTYDSAYRYIDQYGNRFGLLIFDEIHHLPASTYSQIPELSMAPYRLGLTATYQRSDAQHLKLTHLVGPVVYEQKIKDLKGKHLSNYEIQRIRVSLAPDEKSEYESNYQLYHKYVKETGVRYYGNRWENFIKASGFNPEARRALLARKQMRQIVFGAKEKMMVLESLLKQHTQDRIIIFTYDNQLVYDISKRYIIPAITHQTDIKERKRILENFRKGSYRYIVTSKVLNEGVDVPEANVAIVLGGSANPVEQIQRLGRILRKKNGKNAVLYEIVTSGTQESNISYRRRSSDAYL